MINKKRKPTPVKSTIKETKPETTQSEPVQEEKVTQPVEEVTPTPTPTPTSETKVEPPTPPPPSKPKPLTMSSLKSELDELRTLVQTLTT